MMRGREELGNAVNLVLSCTSIVNPSKSYRMIFSEKLFLSASYQEDLKNLVTVSFYTSKGISNHDEFFNALVSHLLPFFNEKNLFLFCDNIFALELQTKTDGAFRNTGFAKSLLRAQYEMYKENPQKRDNILARHARNHLPLFKKVAKTISKNLVACLAELIAFNIMPALNTLPKKFDPKNYEKNKQFLTEVEKERAKRLAYWINQIETHDSVKPLRLSESYGEITCEDIRKFLSAYNFARTQTMLARTSKRTKDLINDLERQLKKENAEENLSEIEKKNTLLMIDFAKEVKQTNPDSRALGLIITMFGERISKLSEKELTSRASNLVNKSYMSELEKIISQRQSVRKYRLFSSGETPTTTHVRPQRLGNSSPVSTRRATEEKGKEKVNRDWEPSKCRRNGNNG